MSCDEIMINSIAVCAGSGGELLRGKKADLYITGEMSHHDVLDATHRGTTVLLLEHSDSELHIIHHVLHVYHILILGFVTGVPGIFRSAVRSGNTVVDAKGSASGGTASAL
ncbi:NIF3-like protein 1 [Diaphorina citri]|uniref:NIF3-like protein 1 n=1 Tax=Diaphorina citri TaxID=121845 RepID=A0A3Q0JET9_DIACI|nr:NIF3-like protein 1 [Diaphorina citri]